MSDSSLRWPLAARLVVVLLGVALSGCAALELLPLTSDTADVVPGSAAPPPPDALELHVFDVGQGDAALLRTAEGAVLIDTGPHTGDVVVDHLRRLGVDRLDLVVVTHPHADHIGQLDRVLSAVDVDEVWFSGAVHTTATFARAVEALEGSDAAYAEPRAGDRATVAGLHIEVLNPPEPPEAAGSGDLDDSGIALRLRRGDRSVLATGDMGAAAEAQMVARQPSSVAAEVYLVGHHGSSTSTGADLLTATQPDLAVYSAGRGNSYGHPHLEVVEALVGAGVGLYGTPVHGTVLLRGDPDGWSVATEHDQPPISEDPR